MRSRWLSELTLLVLVGCVTCRSHVDEELLPAGEQRGDVLFANHCAACHGLDGRGQALPAQNQIGVLSSDLTSPVLQARYTDDSLSKVIQTGIAPAMPAFEQVLSAEELVDIVNHIRKLNTATATHEKI